MREVTFEEATQSMTSQLESVLAKLALSAQSNLSTYNLEDKAKKLAGKLKASAEILSQAQLYADVSGVNVYNPDVDLPDSLFARYAKLCRQSGSALTITREGENYYAELAKGLFVRLNDLPEVEIPKFQVRIDGRTIVAVSDVLMSQLPPSARRLLGSTTEEE